MRTTVSLLVSTVGLFAVLAAPAAAQSAAPQYAYEPCAAVGVADVVQVVGATCEEAETVARQVVARPTAQAAAALKAAGWTALRARSTKDETAYDLVAVRGSAALRIRRRGAAPDVDGWEAGRELIFARPHIVGGQPVPKGAVVCTSAWLVRLPGGSLGGLSAAHCGGLRKDRTVQRRYVGLRRPPQPGIVLGRVKRILTRTLPLDALVVPVSSTATRSALPVIDRGVSRPPWNVIGFARPLAGRSVCFSGRTSGIDRCGRMAGSRARGAERVLSAFAGFAVRCTSIRASPGDSGAPVFTTPRSGGAVRAVGIVSIILVSTRQMCFTPLGPVLDELNARLVGDSG
jgi:hypothetical protein